MIAGFQHIGVYCNSIDKSLSFYIDKLGFKHLFSTEIPEGDKRLKMAWVKGWGIAIELIEHDDEAMTSAAAKSLNHVALRTDDMDSFVEMLNERDVAIEVGPIDPPMIFDRPLDEEDVDVFKVYGNGGAQLRVLFFRGPDGERFEVIQDNIAEL